MSSWCQGLAFNHFISAYNTLISADNWFFILKPIPADTDMHQYILCIPGQYNNLIRVSFFMKSMLQKGNCFFCFLTNISHIFSVLSSGWLSWLSSLLFSVVPRSIFRGSFSAAGRSQALLENEITTSIKLVSRWKHEVPKMCLVDGCVYFGLDKSQWTNTWKWLSTSTERRNYTLDFKQIGFSPQTRQDLDFEVKCKIYSQLKYGLL